MDSKKATAGRDPVTPDRRPNVERPESSPIRKPTRRHVLKAKEGPTNIFLQSISTADIAIPTVELEKLDEDMVMLERDGTPTLPREFLAPKTPSLRYTTPPPKPRIQHESWYEDDEPLRPEWQTRFDQNSPQYDVGSIGSDFSERSFFSSAYTSNGSCTSPESDVSDAMFPLRDHQQPMLSNYSSLNKSSKRYKTVSDGLWSSEMNKHLWATFEKYSADPTVTPYYSASPPEGVYRRVASQAKRTWKGGLEYGDKYGSSSSKPMYVAWPHSGSATRNHLREMVKRHLNSAPVQNFGQSRSTSSLADIHPRRSQRNRFTTPEQDEELFSTRDIAVALTTSTSESMQPDGPLAQLSRDPGNDVLGGFAHIRTGRDLVMESEQQREQQRFRDLLEQSRQLYGYPPNHPFLADTYSPSGSKPGNDVPEGSRTYGGPAPSRAREQQYSGFRVHTHKEDAQVPRLESPVNFKGSCSSFGSDLRPICLTQTFMELAKDQKNQESGSNAGEASQTHPRSPLSPRSRRPVVSNEAFKTNPVLPPGWGSGSPALPPGWDSSPPSTMHSDPIERAGLESASASATNTKPATTAPRERVCKPTHKSLRRQRPTTFDRTYFRRFNEEQARLNSGNGSTDVDMAEGSSSEDSSEE